MRSFDELEVAAHRGHRREGEADGVGAVLVDELDRVEDVAERLRHLLALLVADEGMDVDVAERHLAGQLELHHHHPGDPEEDDVEAGDEDARRVVARELGRLLGPAERADRPDAGGEPGVEDVGVAAEGDEDRARLLGELAGRVGGFALEAHDDPLAERASGTSFPPPHGRRPPRHRRRRGASGPAPGGRPSRRRAGRPWRCAGARRSHRDSRHTRPGFWWPHQSWREMHQGSMFSSQWK